MCTLCVCVRVVAMACNLIVQINPIRTNQIVLLLLLLLKVETPCISQSTYSSMQFETII